MTNRVRKNFGSYSRIISEIYRDQKIKSRVETEKGRIEIDLSRLDMIRSDAALTRERLMTDEERFAASPDKLRIEPASGSACESAAAIDQADGFEDALWRMFDEYSEEDSSDTDKLS